MLTDATLATTSANLRRHLAVLCDEIGPRSLSQPAALERAAGYVEEALAGHGYAVQHQPYSWRGGAFRNLAVELPGATL